MEQRTHSSQLYKELLEHPYNWNYERVTHLIETEKANIPTLFPAKDPHRVLRRFTVEMHKTSGEQRAQ